MAREGYMEGVQQLFFYPVVVLLGIFLIICSFKLLFRIILLCICIFLLWLGLSYTGVVPSPWEVFPEASNIWELLDSEYK